MRQSAVVVRPLRQMNGHSSFNEVFLDEARCPRAMSLAIRDVDGRRHLPRLLMNADWRRHAGELVLVQEAGSGRRRQRSNGRRANHISGIHSALDALICLSKERKRAV